MRRLRPSTYRVTPYRVVAAIALGLAATLGAGGASVSVAQDKAQAARPTKVALTPAVLEVLAAPRILPGSDGRFHLVYELRVSNATPLQIDIKSVEVLAAGGRQVVARLDTAAVAKRLAVGADRGQMRARLQTAQYGILFLHVSFPDRAGIPDGLTHRVRVAFAPAPDGMDVVGGATSVVRTPAPVLGAPLRGKNYISADSCCDTIRHVRALLPINGAFWLAQRFAIDWEQIDATGRVFVGDAKKVGSYHIYGKDVLAVADGTVVSALDGLPDQIPGALPKGLPVEHADGNNVVLKIAGGVFVLYAHLKPGSVRIRPGQKVQKGQVIGQVGNSGNTTEPHLHLHAMDGPSPLASNGIPYVFESFRISGGNDKGTEDFDRAAAEGTPMSITRIAPPTDHRRQLPLDLRIVEWTK